MTELKTQPTRASVTAFLSAIDDPDRRKDARALAALFRKATGKAALTIYLMGGVTAHPALLKQLGAHKVGGGCLYIRRLADVDTTVLSRLIAKSHALNLAKYRTAAGRKAASRGG